MNLCAYLIVKKYYWLKQSYYYIINIKLFKLFHACIWYILCKDVFKRFVKGFFFLIVFESVYFDTNGIE